MSQVHVIIDTSYVAWQSHYAFGILRHGDQMTSAIFGLMRLVRTLALKYSNPHFVFAFDGHRNLRKEKYSWYKRRGNPKDIDIAEIRKLIHQQLDLLREDILPQLGFTNLLYQNGYEADDLIAYASRAIRSQFEDDLIVMYSNDKDLYQLLGRKIIQYRRHNNIEITTNKQSFKNEFHGCKPKDWPSIKAVAGCRSDTIAGLHGVGEQTAAMFFGGKKVTRTNPLIIQDFIDSEQYKINLSLTKLPYPGTNPAMTLAAVKFPAEKLWRMQMKRYGITSLSDEIDQVTARKGMVRAS